MQNRGTVGGSTPSALLPGRSIGSGQGRKRKSFAALVFLLLFLSLLGIMLITALSLPHILDATTSVQHGPHLDALQFFAAAASRRSDEEDPTIHLVFSTSCSRFQHWQSFAFFYHAWRVKQPGTVTRIVTGCKAEEEEEVRRHFDGHVAPLSDGFRLYFTPDFSELNKGNYQTTKYFNKPFGVRSWLESAVGFPDVSQETRDSIFVIMDPDMILMKPLVNSFSPKDVFRFPRGLEVNLTSDEAPSEIHVRHGTPFAARYGYGSSWLSGIKQNLTHVVGADSPVHSLSAQDANAFYSIGPPYIATGKDLYEMVLAWADMTPST